MQADVRASLIGSIAIALWALLALFTAWAGDIPPFQLTAMSFAIGSLVGAVFVARGQKSGSDRWAPFRQPPKVWTFGIAGLFGYHFLYFSALQNAPALEAGLIAYLWPLLIVVGSALLPGERLRWFHVAGALAGALGCAVLVTRGAVLTGGFTFEARYGFGYLLAIGCALTWSAYSLISRTFSTVPTDVVAGFCAATSVLALIAHLALEETVWTIGLQQWLAIFGLGLGPVGLAFYVWDLGMKRGRIQLLGAASYLTPLLSTLVLIAAGVGQLSWSVAAAALLVTGGAMLAAKDVIFPRKLANHQKDEA
ncbi:MAG: EamA family transporter [Pseudomonadota bacterium]